MSNMDLCIDNINVLQILCIFVGSREKFGV